MDRECFGNLSLVLDLVLCSVLVLCGGWLAGLAAGPEHGAEVAVGGGEPQHGQHVGHQAEQHLPDICVNEILRYFHSISYNKAITILKLELVLYGLPTSEHCDPDSGQGKIHLHHQTW